MQPYEKGKGKPKQTREMMDNRIYHSLTKIDNSYKPLLKARNVQRYYRNETSGFIKYGPNLAAPRNERIFKGSRILINRILSKSTIDGFYIEEEFINNTDVFNLIPKTNTINVKALSVFVLSKLCATFFRKENVNLSRAAFPKINVNTLERFPLPNLSKDTIKVLENYADKISSTVDSYVKTEVVFSRYLQSQFSIEKLPKKLENWHELAFADFIKELNKAIKKASGEKLSKIDEMEWMEVFEAKKAEAQSLKAEIDKTDKEIDQMVYELYGLTEEEIAIVEGV